MNKTIFFLLFLFTVNVFSYELSINDSCTYIFKAKKWYDAELKTIVTKINENSFKLKILQRNGAVKASKTLTFPKELKKDNILKTIIDLTKSYTDYNIKINYSHIEDNYKFLYRQKKYKGILVKAHLLINDKIYKISYIFSKEIPVTGLFRFTITQDINSKKKYKFKNIMLIKECKTKGKLIKL